MKLNNVLHKGPRLLVPIRLDAMVVDAALLRGQEHWARIRPNFLNLTGSTEPARNRSYIFEAAKQQEPDKGVHIQWILPDGLCHGMPEKAGGEPIFPRVPDHWLVTRIWSNMANELQTPESWVIQSSNLEGYGTSPHGLQFLQNSSGQLQTKIIGKATPLKEWDGQPPKESADLTGFSPLNPVFNSYTVANENVFSFVDTLTDIPESTATKGIKLNYLVTGWYSNKKNDPLYQATYNSQELLETLKRFEFGIGGAAGLARAVEKFKQWCGNTQETLVPLMLCHGAIHAVPWKGPNNEDQTVSQTGQPKIRTNNQETAAEVIIGNSSFDVLATFIKGKLEEDKGLSPEKTNLAMDFLYALDQQMLEEFVQPQGYNLLASRIQQSWFRSLPGGGAWEIQQVKSPQTEAEATAQKSILNQALLQLKNLNQNQREYDRQYELRVSLLRALYTAQYAMQISGDNYDQWVAATKALKGQVQDLKQKLDSLQATISTELANIRKILKISSTTQGSKSASGFSLKQVPEPSYWKPADPVLLISAAKTAHKYGFHEELNCRYSGQTISGLTLHDQSGNLALKIAELPNLTHLPKEIPGLLREFALLNPGFSAVLSAAKHDEVEIQQTMIWNPELYEGLDVALLTKDAGFEGTRPAFRAFQKYTPPWSPLFMDWVFYYFPKNGEAQNSPAKTALIDWDLAGDGSFDFGLKPEAKPPVVANTEAFSKEYFRIPGRSLISSHMPEVLKAKLQHLNSKELNPVQSEIIDSISNLLDSFDLITQQVSGFHDILLQYDIYNPIPASLIFTDPGDEDLIKEIDAHMYGCPSAIGNHYYQYPIRAGFGLPHYIRVVDDFGISISPNQNDFPTSGNYTTVTDTNPIPKGRGMYDKKVADSRLALLPPRLLQPSRLVMEWADAAAGQNRRVSQGDQNTPVCGWILANYMDKSLMIFDAMGLLQGSLIFYQKGSRFYVAAEPAPIGADPGLSNLQNPHLKGFVEGLLSFNEGPADNGTALSAFLEEIDMATWINDPQGARNKKGLSALVGRPLALVRARVGLDLKGEVMRLYDQGHPKAYGVASAPDTLGLKEVGFPFLIGVDDLPQNGIIGYFAGTDYKKFFVTTKYTSSGATYIEQRNTLTTTLNDSTMTEDHRHYQYCTLLFDYRGEAHVTSGMHPVFSLQLPDHFVKEALSEMEVAFRTGPLISDPRELRMPIPGDVSGQLFWVYQSGITIWPGDKEIQSGKAWEHADVSKPLQNAALSDAQNFATEGWLDLKKAIDNQKK